MPNYGDPKYWEQRYVEQKETTFDWLEDYETLKPIISEFKLDKSSKILVLGCGNAEFSEDIYDDGFHNIKNIDISETVISCMQLRNQTKVGMTYEIMDVRDLKYPDKHFDIAIDKSTIDALLCGDNSFLNVAMMTKEVQRVLKTGGIYMVISYGAPENRVFHFEREHLGFTINIYTIKKDYQGEEEEPGSEKVHYVYICKKKPEADLISQEKFITIVEELKKQELLEEYQNINNNGDDVPEGDDLDEITTEEIKENVVGNR